MEFTRFFFLFFFFLNVMAIWTQKRKRVFWIVFFILLPFVNFSNQKYTNEWWQCRNNSILLNIWDVVERVERCVILCAVHELMDPIEGVLIEFKFFFFLKNSLRWWCDIFVSVSRLMYQFDRPKVHGKDNKKAVRTIFLGSTAIILLSKIYARLKETLSWFIQISNHF